VKYPASAIVEELSRLRIDVITVAHRSGRAFDLRDETRFLVGVGMPMCQTNSTLNDWSLANTFPRSCSPTWHCRALCGWAWGGCAEDPRYRPELQTDATQSGLTRRARAQAGPVTQRVTPAELLP
jgi:hypothetical protein